MMWSSTLRIALSKSFNLFPFPVFSYPGLPFHFLWLCTSQLLTILIPAFPPSVACASFAPCFRLSSLLDENIDE
ncbi:hypothetical protein BJY01DRAFT_211169 [Aspergillus pseudoustus]|uniref:Uncharacterized protein n=1 Tax=Aspergillus pseudoustus TaxID=1810923 RepID=A0ABR4KA58_9EURO